MSNIVTFPGKQTSGRPRSISSSGRPYRVRGEKNMHTLLFRSRETILESDEADLVQDVCFDIDRAQRKLKRIQARMESLQEYAVTELQLLTAADTKLSAAIVAALLSGQR
jgi:tRNA(Phe) wybutosine-synthesizing methylase Tyw3